MASNSGTADGSPIFFYKEQEKDYGIMSNFYFQAFTAPDPAQWLLEGPDATPTTDNTADIEFSTSEQYFMYCKAVFFGDKDTGSVILNTKSPTECKALGRCVTNFVQWKWEEDNTNVRAMEEALWWKFGGGQLSRLLEEPENKVNGYAAMEVRMEAIGDLGRRLLATDERELIEASGRDRYWGIGYTVKQGPHFYKKNWGRNQLGKSLMATRERLRGLVER